MPMAGGMVPAGVPFYAPPSGVYTPFPQTSTPVQPIVREKKKLQIRAPTAKKDSENSEEKKVKETEASKEESTDTTKAKDSSKANDAPKDEAAAKPTPDAAIKEEVKVEEGKSTEPATAPEAVSSTSSESAPTEVEVTSDVPAVSEPASSEPAPSESTSSESAASEPAPTEPASTEPASSEPAPSEPTPTEPASSEPPSSEPAPTEPAPTEPASSESSAAEVEVTSDKPDASEPASSKASSSEDASSESAPSEVASSEPASNEAASSEATSEPSSTESASSEPAPTEPASTESAPSEPASTETSSTESTKESSTETSNEGDESASVDDAPVGEDDKEATPAEEPEKPSFSLTYPKDIWTPQNQEGSKKYPFKLLQAFQKHFNFIPEGLSEKIIADIKSNNLGSQGGAMPRQGRYPLAGNSPGRPSVPMQMRGGMNPRMYRGVPMRGHPQGHPQHPQGHPQHQGHPQGHPQLQNPGVFMQGPRGGPMYSMMGPPQHGAQSQQWVSRAEPVEPLKKSANAWERPKKMDDTEEGRRKMLLMKVNGLLNKITEETFTLISDQILALGIDTMDTMEGVINLLYEKALLDHGYSSMYADLCAKLSQLKTKIDGKERTFRVALLARCQEKFEGTLRDRVPTERSEEDKDLTEEEWEDKIYLMYHKIRGNIRFISELYKKKLLAPSVIRFCIIQLTDDSKNNKVPESMECLCKLLVNVGKDFDQGKGGQLDRIFDTLDALSKDKTVDSRMRFMFDDVIALRKRGWKEIKKDDIGRKEGEVDRRPTGKRMPSRGSLPREGSHSKLKSGGGGWGRQPQQRMGTPKKSPMQEKQQLGMRKQPASPVSPASLSSPAAPSSPASPAAPASPAPKSAATPATPEPTPANSDPFRYETDLKIEKEINSMIAEFKTSRDDEEASLCVKDLKDPSSHYVVVLRSLLLSTESKEKDREAIVQMLDGLNKSKTLNNSHFVMAFDRCLKVFLPDVAIDVPFAPKVYGQLFARGVSSGWIDSFSHLFKWVKGVEDDPRLVGDIVGSALETGLKTNGLDGLRSSLKEGGIEKFEDLFSALGAGMDADRFVGKFGLDDLKQAMQ